VTLMLDPVDGHLEASGEPVADVSDSGDFIITGVLPGRYLFRATRLIVKTVEWRGSDYADSGIGVSGDEELQGVRVVLTDNGGTISGVVADGGGRATTDAGVLCFPVEPSQWRDFGIAPSRIRVVRPSDAGRYMITRVPAGEYYVAAVPWSEADRWQEPGYLRSIAGRADRITVGWGDEVTRDLRRLQSGRAARR